MSSVANLRNEHHFPTFESCPDDNDIDPRYHTTTDGFRYGPSRHWCLLAEIESSIHFLRLRLVVRDKAGLELPVAFHLEDGHNAPPLQDFPPGHTVAILYAEQHHFLDFSMGVRQENAATLQVIPLKLHELLALSDRVRGQAAAGPQGRQRTCHACGARSAALLKCGRCTLFWYCNAECQVRGWVERGHRADCRVLRKIGGLFSLDWARFEHFVGFPLAVGG